jgi:hypothetical protein
MRPTLSQRRGFASVGNGRVGHHAPA